jgi:RNA polymerase primary sigma factor
MAADRDLREDATLQAYLRELRRFPPTTPEEERTLGERIRANGDEEAVRRLVEGNLRFVVSYARRYRNLGVPFVDLVHEGNLGLIEAARRFDPSRNVKFITYAVWWIRQAIMHLLASQARPFALPPRLSVAASRLGREEDALAETLDRSPTPGELAGELRISESDLDALRLIGGADVSLSDVVSGGDGERRRERGELLEQADPHPADEALLQQVLVHETRRALDALEPREREVMRLRSGLDEHEPMTLQQIGERFQLSRERVRQIEARAREKLRRSKRLRDVRASLN